MKEIENIIEQYLLGNLSPEDVSSFENKMAQNNDLKSKVDLQRDTIEAIKNSRRLAIKQNLSQINPAVGTSNMLIQKIVIGAATLTTALVVGIGIYSTSVKEKQVIEAAGKETIIKVAEKETPLVDNDVISKVAPNSEEPQLVESNESIVSEKPVGKRIIKEDNTEVDNNIPSKPFIPDGNFSNNNATDNYDVDTDESGNDFPVASSELFKPLAVKYVPCKGNDEVPSYKYKNGVYEFCGIGKSEPTIIEITSGNSKFEKGSKYLQYNKNYYEIVPTSSYEDIDKHIVTDKDLRIELKKHKF